MVYQSSFILFLFIDNCKSDFILILIDSIRGAKRLILFIYIYISDIGRMTSKIYHQFWSIVKNPLDYPS